MWLVPVRADNRVINLTAYFLALCLVLFVMELELLFLLSSDVCVKCACDIVNKLNLDR